MTTPGGSVDPSVRSSMTTATDETEPASSLQADVRQAAGEVARSLPPMTAEQAALIRHLLRDQHH
ncbi:hypothetical protein [Rudaeicoccus suwonensis]|uniref:Uncharacterized protein n=1 Tax=Rudaeicoccus suwonensis TaxID=657409 RepID=A0A561EBU8_9MICO|nr:hypothetical protein [Rudaeicoccus suwonensis]TWE13089.1 hypothetical protein BKA23_1917 [Rudaeicoccus suwonensis]